MTCAIKKMQNICASSFHPLYFGTPAMHHFQILTSVNLFKLNCLDQTGQFFIPGKESCCLQHTNRLLFSEISIMGLACRYEGKDKGDGVNLSNRGGRQLV